MQQNKPIELVSDACPGLTTSGYRETPFFSTMAGQLCQWIEVDLACTQGWRTQVKLEISAGGQTARRTVVVKQGEHTLRAYAPALWPAPASRAELRVRTAQGEIVGYLTVGSYRPWTCYLLSDCCADDSWAYSDLAAHDRDDYRTTLAELAAGEENRYNYPSVYQVARFCRQATPEEKAALCEALQSGRFYLSPVPNQLLCGAFTLSAYPLLLEPYRHWRAELGVGVERASAQPGAAGQTAAAYHMEAPTWTNGLVNLLACAGFRLFGKSLLRYLAPWLDALETLPVLTRLQVAPGRSVLLVLNPNGYSEGFPLLAGMPQGERWLHGEFLPPAFGTTQAAVKSVPPSVSALPIVGMYSDLCPEMPEYVDAKSAAVSEYAAQPWEYPRLVNGTWEGYAAHVERELGTIDANGLRTVRGDTGSSWEAWMSAAQVELARFRRAQRDVVALRTLRAMLPPLRSDVSLRATLHSAVLELVELGDHAWNGSSEASKQLNLSIRRDRLARIEAGVSAVRNALFKADIHGGLPQVGVVNTLGWTRTCRANLPWEWGFAPSCLADPLTGEAFPIWREGRATWADVTAVPGFGCRTLELRRGLGAVHAQASLDRWPLAANRMRPLLLVGERELAAEGGWRADGRGQWRVGAFGVEATGRPSPLGEGLELLLSVEGVPPEEPYELRWLFDLPWTEADWRGESGGGFVTPGPVEQGGDSLLGITGSIFSCGEGLCAISPDGRGVLDFSFDQTGLCGLGGRSTRAAQGSYGERLPPDVVRLSTWDSTRTPARLEWYLLATAQNHREALIDQGGARRWSFRCVLRKRRGAPGDRASSDVALYRFACGANTPAELVDPDVWSYEGPWLTVDGDLAVAHEQLLVLGAFRDVGGATCFDLYNTSSEQVSPVLRGPAVEGRSAQLADMLGRVKAACPGGRLSVEPLAFVRVTIL